MMLATCDQEVNLSVINLVHGTPVDFTESEITLSFSQTNTRIVIKNNQALTGCYLPVTGIVKMSRINQSGVTKIRFEKVTAMPANPFPANVSLKDNVFFITNLIVIGTGDMRVTNAGYRLYELSVHQDALYFQLSGGDLLIGVDSLTVLKKNYCLKFNSTSCIQF